MSVTVGPTTRSLLRGLVALRWATWGWSVAVVLASTDRLARPWLAVLLLAAALGVNVATTAAVRAGREMVFRRLIVADLAVAFGMLALEGFAFEEGHAFAGRQGLAGGWPVAGILTAGVTSGPYVGAAAGAGVGTARLLGALANGVRDFDGDQVTAVAGAVGEAITNVGKHAGVGRAVVFAERQDDGTVFVSVRDEGCGFTADGGGDGRGVRGSIVGRVNDAGGRAEVVSEPGHGTEVRLWVR